MQNNCNQQIVMAVAIIGLAVLCWDSRGAYADDWPQWRGPRRDGVSSENGLMQSWPTGGPKVAWQAAGLGTGYSSVIVGQGRLFSMGRKESDVVVFALDEATGKTVWTRKIGETSRHPCSTPTLDGDLLYALDPDGDLVWRIVVMLMVFAALGHFNRVCISVAGDEVVNRSTNVALGVCCERLCSDRLWSVMHLCISFRTK